MLEEYSKEQLWKIYEKLPEELKNAIFSEETAKTIGEICERNNIEEKTSEVAKYTGRVLMGILPPNELPEILEEKVGLEKEVSKKISQEIHHFIFYPVKSNLEELYKTQITFPVGITSETKPEKPKRVDIYREPIE